MQTLQNVPERATQLQDQAFESVRLIASDTRYSVDHKKTEITRILAEAVTELDSLERDALSDLEKTRAELRAASRPTLTPSADDAIRLGYLRDALDELWATQNNTEFLAGWKEAIDEGDPLLLRVYRDFGIGELRSREPYSDLDLADVQDLTPAGDLIQRTHQALLTPDQRAAVDQLAQLERSVIQVKRAIAGARARLTRARYNPRTNDIVDGVSNAAREVLRGAW